MFNMAKNGCNSKKNVRNSYKLLKWADMAILYLICKWLKLPHMAEI